jgi:hypothetical protein
MGLNLYRGFESLGLRQGFFNAPTGALSFRREAGSSPLTGEGHSSDTIDHTAPTSVGKDSQPVTLRDVTGTTRPMTQFRAQLPALFCRSGSTA